MMFFVKSIIKIIHKASKLIFLIPKVVINNVKNINNNFYTNFMILNKQFT